MNIKICVQDRYCSIDVFISSICPINLSGRHQRIRLSSLVQSPSFLPCYDTGKQANSTFQLPVCLTTYSHQLLLSLEINIQLMIESSKRLCSASPFTIHFRDSAIKNGYQRIPVLPSLPFPIIYISATSLGRPSTSPRPSTYSCCLT